MEEVDARARRSARADLREGVEPVGQAEVVAVGPVGAELADVGERHALRPVVDRLGSGQRVRARRSRRSAISSSPMATWKGVMSGLVTGGLRAGLRLADLRSAHRRGRAPRAPRRPERGAGRARPPRPRRRHVPGLPARSVPCVPAAVSRGGGRPRGRCTGERGDVVGVDGGEQGDAQLVAAELAVALGVDDAVGPQDLADRGGVDRRRRGRSVATTWLRMAGVGDERRGVVAAPRPSRRAISAERSQRAGGQRQAAVVRGSTRSAGTARKIVASAGVL